MPTIAGWIAKGHLRTWHTGNYGDRSRQEHWDFKPPLRLPKNIRWDHDGPRATADANATVSYANLVDGGNLYRFEDGSALLVNTVGDYSEVRGTVPGPWTELD